MPALSLLAGVLVALLMSTGSVGAEGTPEPSRPTFWVIPHTHWEGAVFKTREEYLEMGLPNILKAMKLLREQPEFRFVLDQVAYVKPFLERYPEHEADFRKFLKEGRLELTGALDIMPDVNMPGGETFVRQIQYGKGYYREKLGVDVKIGWPLDTFGQHAQIPQLFKLAGFTSAWFQRGVTRPDHPSEFLWEGIDGTRIPAFWLPHSYGLLYHSPKEAPAFDAFMRKRYAMLDANSYGNDRVGMAGADVSEPEEHLVPMIKAFNEQKDAPFQMRLAVPSEFEAVVARRTDRPAFRGELNPIFQGAYSSRIELKHWIRTLEQKLVTSEKLAALGGWLGRPAQPASLWRAGEPLLFNETHDLASGVMTDHVYEDTVRNYEFVDRLADEQIAAGWQALAASVDTRGPGVPILVFNPLGWTRTDVVEADLGFADGSTRGFTVRDEAGRDVPAQLVRETRYADGTLRTARVALLASDLPALGYRVFHAVAMDRPGFPEAAKALDRDSLETGRFRIRFDRSTGAITGLQMKDGDWEVFSGPANVVSRLEDRGDLWEPYRGLDGGSKIAMTTRQEIPAPGKAVFSNDFKDKPGTLRGGPVYSEFQVAHPFDSGRFETTVRVYEGLGRIDCRTALVNQEKYVRYHALFPTDIEGGKSVHEIPFGTMQRPSGIEFPAQNWVDHGDGRRGLAILNIGLPGNVETDGTMMVSLLRAHTLGAYGFGGGYEPGMSSESGFQLGKERVMRYALVPHAGDWRSARVFRDGLEFNHPLIAKTVAAHEGRLPGSWGLLDVDAPNVVLSALQPSRQGRVAIRVYEAAGQAIPEARVAFHVPVSAGAEVNLLEDVIKPVAVENHELKFALRPFEIKTFVVALGSGSGTP
ncbi:MAG: glycoside hydrolase family 38 C-terminal domain-containing protein [Isosphaeraceae bacterium]